MSVLSYLDACTCHISKETNDFLERVAGNNSIGQTVAEYEHGFFISVPPEAEYDATVPNDLRSILDFARTKGCFIVRLDADADLIDDLPTFNW